MESKEKTIDPASAAIGEVVPLTTPTPQEPEGKGPKQHPLDQAVSTFLADMGAISKTYRLVLPHVLKWLKEQHQKNSGIFKKFATDVDEEGNEFYRAESAHQVSELLNAIRDMESLRGLRIAETLQRSMYTQLFSEFDAFVGALLKVVYTKKSDLLKSIAREITFSDLLKYEDLNAIKMDMLDKEIESFRRDSYIDQFGTLETKFNIKTLRGFAEWGEFVELSQRRNICVHNGGRVSAQYLLVCDREGHKFLKRPDVGDPLEIHPEYFYRAVIVLSKVAFMLTHTLWRKLFPEEVQLAHGHANDTLYELLKEKRWKTSLEIARFCLNEQMKKDIGDLDWRIRVVNAAIAAKFTGHTEEAQRTLDAVDWTASYRDFKLARAVLMDNFDEASQVMKSIGKTGEMITELAYHDWPLFHKFRESPEFLNAYQEIYQTSFVKEAVRKSAESSATEIDPKEATATVVDVPATEVDARKH